MPLVCGLFVWLVSGLSVAAVAAVCIFSGWCCVEEAQFHQFLVLDFVWRLGFELPAVLLAVACLNPELAWIFSWDEELGSHFSFGTLFILGSVDPRFY